jgi:hypothetical protein
MHLFRPSELNRRHNGPRLDRPRTEAELEERLRLYVKRFDNGLDLTTGKPLKGQDATQWLLARFDRSEGEEGEIDTDEMEELCSSVREDDYRRARETAEV